MFDCKVSAKILDEHTSARTRKMGSLFKGYSYDRGRTGDDTMRTQEKILLEQALAEALKKQQAEQWLAENSEAVNAYNREVEAHGVFSDQVRSF